MKYQNWFFPTTKTWEVFLLIELCSEANIWEKHTYLKFLRRSLYINECWKWSKKSFYLYLKSEMIWKISYIILPYIYLAPSLGMALFMTSICYLSSFFFFFVFCLFRATPTAYGGSQARGLIGAVATGLHHNHSHAGSEPCLWLTPQLTATPDP